MAKSHKKTHKKGSKKKKSNTSIGECQEILDQIALSKTALMKAHGHICRVEQLLYNK